VFEEVMEMLNIVSALTWKIRDAVFDETLDQTTASKNTTPTLKITDLRNVSDKFKTPVVQVN
jgi:hypothetical protein